MKQDLPTISLLIKNHIQISKNDLVQALYTDNTGLFITLANAYAGPLPAYLVHIAVKKKFEDALQYLLNIKVPCSEADQQGYTPLHHAAEQGDVMITLQLIKAGAPLNATNKAGNTPLALAAQSLHYEVCCILLGAKAILFTKNHRGLSPYVLALDASRATPKALIPSSQDQPKAGPSSAKQEKEPLALLYLRKKSEPNQTTRTNIDPKVSTTAASDRNKKAVFSPVIPTSTVKNASAEAPFIKQGRYRKRHKVKV